MPERWLYVDEIAAHLGVNPDSIYNWITLKRMLTHKLGRLWKFLASEVDQVRQACGSGHREAEVRGVKNKRHQRDGHEQRNPLSEWRLSTTLTVS